MSARGGPQLATIDLRLRGGHGGGQVEFQLSLFVRGLVAGAFKFHMLMWRCDHAAETVTNTLVAAVFGTNLASRSRVFCDTVVRAWSLV